MQSDGPMKFKEIRPDLESSREKIRSTRPGRGWGQEGEPIVFAFSIFLVVTKLQFVGRFLCLKLLFKNAKFRGKTPILQKLRGELKF